MFSFEFVDVEKFVNSLMGIDHFASIAKAEADIKEGKDKLFIKTSYLGLETTVVANKITFKAEDDNCDMTKVMNFFEYAKPGSEMIIDSNIGEISFYISDNLTMFLNNKSFNAVMNFKNEKAKKVFFGLRDLTQNKITVETFKELVNAYYYSIK